MKVVCVRFISLSPCNYYIYHQCIWCIWMESAVCFIMLVCCFFSLSSSETKVRTFECSSILGKFLYSLLIYNWVCSSILPDLYCGIIWHSFIHRSQKSFIILELKKKRNLHSIFWISVFIMQWKKKKTARKIAQQFDAKKVLAYYRSHFLFLFAGTYWWLIKLKIGFIWRTR